MRIFSEFEHHAAAESDASGRERIAANLSSVRATLAVASAKGGTGKSALAVNMAAALAHAGRKIAVVDADFNGPSALAMLGIRAPGCLHTAETIEPALGPFGLRVVAGECLPGGEPPPISFLGEEPEAAAQTAPLAESSHSAALRRLLGQTRFGPLDLLIVDLAPGLDALYRLTRIVKLGGVLFVSRPSAGAGRHLCRALAMGARMGAPLAGVVENMAGFACEICHSVKPLFPPGENARVAREASVAILARLPFDPRFAECSDRGRLFVHEFPEAPVAKQIAEVARRLDAFALGRARPPGATEERAAPLEQPPSPGGSD